MTDPLFPRLSDAARLWIYAADRDLQPHEQSAVEAAMDEFCSTWTSHRRPVYGAAQMLLGRFLVVAAEIPGGDVSGCGIDASVHALDAVAAQHGFGWLPGLYVFYRDAGGVQAVPRGRFRELARAGAVTARTHVFDLGVATLGELRRGAFERPAAESWHGRVFRLVPEPA